jgi:hypothetical protein
MVAVHGPKREQVRKSDLRIYLRLCRILEGYLEILIEALPAIDDDGTLTPLYTKSFNISQVIYVINSISTIYKYGTDGLTLHFSSKTLPGYIESVLVASLPVKYRFDYPFGILCNTFLNF